MYQFTLEKIFILINTEYSYTEYAVNLFLVIFIIM